MRPSLHEPNVKGNGRGARSTYPHTYTIRRIDSVRHHFENREMETEMTAYDPNNGKTAIDTAKEKVGNYAQEASNRVSEMNDRVQSKVSEVGDRVQARAQQVGRQMREMEIGETTVPDAFRRVPKYISPRVHRWLDVAVTGYFIGLGIWFAVRGKGRAATAAFVNGGMVAGVSAFTDYEGTGQKPISFKMHGTLDAVQATTAALAPVLHGFAGKAEAKYFYIQAGDEVGVIAMTDWDAGMPESQRLNAA